MSDTIDTPDYQRGVVSAQTLLADSAATTTKVTVGVPPNAETIVIVGAARVSGTTPTVLGVQSKMVYQVTEGNLSQLAVPYRVWYVDAAHVVDAELSIGFEAYPLIKWYVYGDAGVHIVVNPQVSSAVYSYYEQPYKWRGLQTAVNVELLTPVAGETYRLGALSLVALGATEATAIVTASEGVNFALLEGAGVFNITYPPPGVVIGPNDGLKVNVAGATPNVFAGVAFVRS